jgi:hypothetical protein
MNLEDSFTKSVFPTNTHRIKVNMGSLDVVLVLLCLFLAAIVICWMKVEGCFKRKRQTRGQLASNLLDLSRRVERPIVLVPDIDPTHTDDQQLPSQWPITPQHNPKDNAEQTQDI